MSQKYTVHIMAVVRVPVKVSASTQQEAIKLVQNNVKLSQVLNDANSGAAFTDEIIEYIVDESNDPLHERTRRYSAKRLIRRPRG
ncbi:MAG: hypothetical protein H0V62_04665 [Gammaproteobacteria bacterium]|nr:hypothetical protein [Gammaproteobacteria bacterium]